MDIGAKVKTLRSEKGYTLREFAEQCKLSPSLVSQVERNATSPSIQTLIKMGEVLGIPVGRFFEEAEEARKQSVVRREQRRKLELPDHIPVYELLTPAHMDGDVRLLRVVLEAGQYSSSEKVEHHDTETCYVLSGEVHVVFPHTEQRLYAGDTISFRSTTPHQFYNPGLTQTELLLVISSL